jgi:hypothetical protein
MSELQNLKEHREDLDIIQDEHMGRIHSPQSTDQLQAHLIMVNIVMQGIS